MFIWIDRSWGCHRMWPSPASRTARYVPQVPDCGCEQKADLVTIGGDLWEDEHVTPDTRRFVASELKDLSLPVLMICGNHDPYLAGGNYARSVWPDNVRICQRDQLTEFQFGPVSVWAVSWLGGRLEMGFLDTLSFERGEIVLGKRTISNLQGRIATSVSFCQSRPVFCSLRQSRLRRFSCCAGRRLRRCLAISISS